jgi:hypothetical protein
MEVEARRRQATAEHPDATALLAQHFAEREKRELDPWWREVERCRVRLRSLEAHGEAERQKRFISLAKDGQLSQSEALAGTYLIFGTEQAQSMFANLSCFEVPEQRLRLHNVYVAEQCGGGLLEQFGKTILALPSPLFPPVQELEALNLRMIREFAYGSTATGGAPPRRSSLFRDPVPVVDEVAEGGGTLPVLVGEQGSYIDTGIIEQAMSNAFAQTRWLHDRVAELQNLMKEKDKPSETISAINKGFEQLKGSLRTAQRTVQPQGYQRQYRTPYYGRGRGGYARPRGGEAEADGVVPLKN